MTDTTTEAVERLAIELGVTSGVLEEEMLGELCAEAMNAAATLRALASERDALKAMAASDRHDILRLQDEGRAARSELTAERALADQLARTLAVFEGTMHWAATDSELLAAYRKARGL